MSAPPCEPGRVLAVVWDRGVWCGLVASGGTCGWIGMGEL